MEFHQLGEEHMLINLEQRIAPEINDQCIAYVEAINKLKTSGILHAANAYCSIKVSFDPKIITYNELKRVIEKLKVNSLTALERRLIRIPVWYNTEYDLEAVSKQLNLSVDKIIELHSSIRYRVYMLGFLPGFPYLGTLDKRLQLARKDQPMREIPKGAIGTADSQTGIYPIISPSGWHILGCTPIDLIDLSNGKFKIKVTDDIKFYPITREEFKQWDKNE